MEEFGCISYLVPKTAMDELALESPNTSQMELKWLPKKLAQAKITLDAAKREWGPRLAALYILLDEGLELLVLEKRFSGGGELYFKRLGPAFSARRHSFVFKAPIWRENTRDVASSRTPRMA